jgi:alkaline phosphatase D
MHLLQSSLSTAVSNEVMSPGSDEENQIADNVATRRAIIRAAGAGSVAGAFAELFATDAAAQRVNPEEAGDKRRFSGTGSTPAVFSLGVASGGPTHSGAICWTRIDPDAYDPNTPLGIEVATDSEFTDIVYQGVVPAPKITPADDYTISVDVDGQVRSNRHYWFRFYYDGAASRAGRFRTLPKPDASPTSLSLALATCNAYQDGYFGGFERIAQADVDYILHMGDFIYETAFYSDYEGREYRLPSGNKKAHTLTDFRTHYRKYRDESMQRALAQHTFVPTWDDHEIVNDGHWNYEADAPATVYHPKGDDPDFMRQLYAAGIKAWTEYVPARVEYDPDADHLHDAFQLYRSLEFGDLADIILTDERLYRSPQPEGPRGNRGAGETNAKPNFNADNQDRTMLGNTQCDWFIDQVIGSDATWKLWTNAVMCAALQIAAAAETYWWYDSWDGYQYERRRIMSAIADADIDNFVAFTGDFHGYFAAYLQQEYTQAPADPDAPEDNQVGVELMTPSMTGTNLGEQGQLPPDAYEDAFTEVVEAGNPHVEWINSSRYGFSTVDITRDGLVYTAYEVDKSDTSKDPDTYPLRIFRVPEGEVELNEYRPRPLDRTIERSLSFHDADPAPYDGPQGLRDLLTAEDPAAMIRNGGGHDDIDKTE